MPTGHSISSCFELFLILHSSSFLLTYLFIYDSSQSPLHMSTPLFSHSLLSALDSPQRAGLTNAVLVQSLPPCQRLFSLAPFLTTAAVVSTARVFMLSPLSSCLDVPHPARRVFFFSFFLFYAVKGGACLQPSKSRCLSNHRTADHPLPLSLTPTSHPDGSHLSMVELPHLDNNNLARDHLS